MTFMYRGNITRNIEFIIIYQYVYFAPVNKDYKLLLYRDVGYVVLLCSRYTNYAEGIFLNMYIKGKCLKQEKAFEAQRCHGCLLALHLFHNICLYFTVCVHYKTENINEGPELRCLIDKKSMNQGARISLL